jgi:hypothetical protein
MFVHFAISTKTIVSNYLLLIPLTIIVVLNVLQKPIKERAETRHEPRKTKEDPNVLMLVIDSLSRAHFIRRLHKTISWLESADSSAGGPYDVVQFFKHHAVECCTPGNMRPMLAGMTKEEVDLTANVRKLCEVVLEYRQLLQHGD